MTSLSSTASPLERAALPLTRAASGGSEPPRGGAKVEPTEMSLYAADLKRRALMLTRGDASRANDLVQDTFERALGSLDRLLPDSNVRAWLYTIMVRRFRDLLRHDRVRRTTSYDDDLELPAHQPDTEPPPRWYDLTSDQIRCALQELNPELRIAFERREFGHLPYQRIAEELGVPVATVGTRLLRARQRLRQILLSSLEQPDPGEPR